MMAAEMKKKLRCVNIPDVEPEGWLKDQFKIQMNGLTGKLYDVWDSVGSYSGWLGGTGENWERAPYYLDGLLPLAYYLKDKEHWDIAERFVEWTLNSVDEEGNFGPVTSKEDYWSRFVMLKVLIQYHEITEDERVLNLMGRYFAYLENELPRRPMTLWSRARGGDLLYCMVWYSGKTGEDLSGLAALVREQSLDWTDIFSNFPYVRATDYYYNWESLVSHYRKPMLDGVTNYHTHHIVNLTMGFKYPAMLAYFFDDMDFEKNAKMGMESAERYHGVACGAINGDEHLGGNDPSRGAELCSVVEYMFSLETMIEKFGSTEMADKLEKLAFNALPATIAEDYMSHQYDQQANQVICSKAKRNWYNNNDEANIFGLEPHFGCCTANMHQGWPKLLKGMWLWEDENTLVSMVHAPSRIHTDVNGKKVEIQEVTNYPFKGEIAYRVISAGAGNMTLKIRIPGWCEAAAASRDSDPQAELKPQDGYIAVLCLKEGETICVKLDMQIKKTHWFRNSVAVERGALVYALDIKENWKPLREVGTVTDYEVYPESQWNYALSDSCELKAEEHEVSGVPFSKANPPVVITGKGRVLESWKLEDNSAGRLPVSPVKVGGEEKEIRLVPYGCTKLRITQFPFYI